MWRDEAVMADYPFNGVPLRPADACDRGTILHPSADEGSGYTVGSRSCGAALSRSCLPSPRAVSLPPVHKDPELGAGSLIRGSPRPAGARALPVTLPNPPRSTNGIAGALPLDVVRIDDASSIEESKLPPSTMVPLPCDRWETPPRTNPARGAAGRH